MYIRKRANRGYRKERIYTKIEKIKKKRIITMIFQMDAKGHVMGKCRRVRFQASGTTGAKRSR